MKKIMLLLLLLPTTLSFAQKMLLLENARKVKPVKFFVGEMLHYKLSEEQSTWFSDEIVDVLPDEQTLILGIQKVKINEIAMLHFPRPILNGLGKQMTLFGVQLLFYSTIGVVSNPKDSFAKKALLVGGASVGTSILVMKIFKHKKIKMGKKHRLRVIEIPTVFF